jgi:hypothetical protein
LFQETAHPIQQAQAVHDAANAIKPSTKYPSHHSALLRLDNELRWATRERDSLVSVCSLISAQHQKLQKHCWASIEVEGSRTTIPAIAYGTAAAQQLAAAQPPAGPLHPQALLPVESSWYDQRDHAQ